ncbi:MAG TPA: hypothetical protein VFW33_04490 [Gemmataceae bacterium]|nr:hypothetical protein [Gemmataceae bacterium]
MPRVLWALHNDRPGVWVQLAPAAPGLPLTRVLLADTGAGNLNTPFELLLRDTDCLLCGGTPLGTVNLARAYRGLHPVYRLKILIPAVGFDKYLRVIGVVSPPTGFDGNACLSFLSRFNHGNFGLANQFGLEY